mmetsp:Transcript_43685/g.69847  ORF Transcript_43685/g.69847 Transcript_43685/m.69847 type:complete len:86 (-) Transcript_43685:1047-1304(-)
MRARYSRYNFALCQTSRRKTQNDENRIRETTSIIARSEFNIYFTRACDTIQTLRILKKNMTVSEQTLKINKLLAETPRDAIVQEL